MKTPRSILIPLVISVIAIGGTTRASEPSVQQNLLSALVKFGVPYTDLPGDDISRLPSTYQNMIVNCPLAKPNEPPRLALCFADGTDPEIVRIVSQVIYGSNNPLDYQAGSRWSSTAHGSTGGQGDPIVLTYSFVPDGVSIPNGIGEGVAPNSLYARMNSLFGSESIWKAKFAQVFAEWTAVCGITYQEVSDDGAPLFTSPGVLGSRGDVRICMKPLDGQYGVLAYNYFPNSGDMVLDQGEDWSWSSNNYVFMRNILAHEHGHGIGLYHVCPTDHTKLMEPYLSTSFDGPRHDDKRGGQRHYGDALENNNTAATATNLGTITGSYTVPDASADDNSDVDWYKFTVSAGHQVTVTLDVVGATYLDGPQNGDGSCSAGTQENTVDDQNLGVRLYDTNGTFILADANSQPAGVDEIISNISLPAAGTYYVQVYPGSADVVQMYNLVVAVSALSNPVLTVNSPNGGEICAIGETEAINWSSLNLTGNVQIQLNRSYPGGTWETLFSNTANDGTENWLPAGTSSTACRIRVTSVTVPTVCDSSNANFSLIALSPPTDVVIRVMSGDVLLNWTATGAPNYRIYSAASSNGPFTTLEGTTPANWFTDAGGASAGNLKFYTVVASTVP